MIFNPLSLRIWRPIPVVVRLEGTNVEIGRQILKDSGLKIIPAGDMADGAKKAIEAAGLKR